MNNITKTEMISEINIIDRDMGQVCSKSEIDWVKKSIPMDTP